ncbi:MAG: ABC transporter permease, partial [Candidatus Obscuribacterales bacterium]|nr:ABC transporter permease [Candidatus Obscuribacterales bacterium]
MQKLITRLPILEIIPWLVPVGLSVRLFAMCLSWSSLRSIPLNQLRGYCRWMGPGSFHFVAISALVIAIALTLQCVIELKKYQAEDLAGAAISIGLLRELGPLTISIAWCARVAALVSEEAKSMKSRFTTEREFAEKFVLPRYLAALISS